MAIEDGEWSRTSFRAPSVEKMNPQSPGIVSTGRGWLLVLFDSLVADVDVSPNIDGNTISSVGADIRLSLSVVHPSLLEIASTWGYGAGKAREVGVIVN